MPAATLGVRVDGRNVVGRKVVGRTVGLAVGFWAETTATAIAAKIHRRNVMVDCHFVGKAEDTRMHGDKDG